MVHDLSNKILDRYKQLDLDYRFVFRIDGIKFSFGKQTRENKNQNSRIDGAIKIGDKLCLSFSVFRIFSFQHFIALFGNTLYEF